MVEVGNVIRATVTRVEPYGLFLDSADGPVAVLLPEVSWSDRRPIQERVRPGDEFDVLVLRYNYRDRMTVGSIRRMQRDQNPYRQLARLEPGVVLRGTIAFVHANEATVELFNGAWGHVSTRNVPPVKRGDELDLVITDVEVEDGRMTLEPAKRAVAGANGKPEPLPSEASA